MSGNLIQCHSILLEGQGVLSQAEMEICNIEPETADVGVGSVLDQLLVGGQGFREEAAACVLVSQIEKDEESEVVVGLCHGGLLSVAQEALLLVNGLFRLVQRGAEFPFVLGQDGLFNHFVNVSLQHFDLLLRPVRNVVRQ